MANKAPGPGALKSGRILFEPARPLLQHLFSIAGFRAIVFLLLVTAINLLFPREKSFETFDMPREGDIAKKTIVAPFTFDILKTAEELKKERAEAEAAVLPFIEYNYDVTEKIFAKFRRFFRQTALLKSPAAPDSLKKAVWADLKRDLSAGAVDAFLRTSVEPTEILRLVDNILNDGICGTLIVKDAREIEAFTRRFNTDVLNPLVTPAGFATRVRDGKEQTVPVTDLRVKEEVLESQRARIKHRVNKELWSAFYELLYAYTAPNLFYDEAETQKRRAAAFRDVLPTRGKVIKDLEIVGKNKLVTPEIHRNIYSLKAAQERRMQEQGVSAALPILGRVLINTLLVLLLFLYLHHARCKLSSRLPGILSLSLALLLQFGIASAALRLINTVLVPLEWGEGLELLYLLPMVFGPLLMAVLYDLELAMVFTLVSALLLGVLLGFDFKITLVHFLAGLSAAWGVRNIRYRAHFFLSLLIYTSAYSVLILLMGLLKYGPFTVGATLTNIGFAAAGGAVSLMLAIPLVWIFERLFGITTNLTLIELSDMNSPALKQLSLEAPGTYHHSVLVGNLAESAAGAIGANPLKTRVLAYYHDIGKISKAEYFIENQMGLRDNLYEKISPRMSALIIASHVKQGVEIARKYNLPP
ncbi:MAG: HDIG domain-containing metalloprotein, partial [Fibrobacterota bacterium]